MIDRRNFLAVSSGAALSALPQKKLASPLSKRRSNFLFGAATAAHQIEGNNVNSDYWVLENIPSSGFSERSGDACDSINRWEEDLALVKKAGLDSYRFSIEWARIEPEEGQFSHAVLDYYRRLCAACRELDIVPIVTFHHFTSPRWVAGMGGWENPATADRYARYCERAAGSLGDMLEFACTINEPNAQVNSYIVAGKKSWDGEQKVQMEAAKAVGSDRFSAFFQGDSLKVRDICIAAHAKGRDAIKSVAPHVKVGITLALQELRAGEGGDKLYKELWEEARVPFYEAVRGDDFVGVQCYNRLVTGPEGYRKPESGAFLDSWDQDAPPEALGHAVREAFRETKIPIFVTEHGINAVDDSLRVRHLEPSLEALLRCSSEGIPLIGYTHWSLLDNYEWSSGYKPRFGLYSVDRTTFKRTAKPSMAAYRKLVTKMRPKFEGR